MSALESRLGHIFRNKNLLIRALTHASADAIISNERLEFLGDRVLGLVIADSLHAAHSDDTEGVLALKLNALVRKEACAATAETAGLSGYLILANSETKTGGRTKAVILAGACEAVIAALYLDGGLDAARRFIERYWANAFATLSADMRDAKTALQEWAQSSLAKSTPVYSILSRGGPDHAPRFVVQVNVGGEQPAEGEGGSKREAEQNAARALLERLGQLPT